MFSIGGSWPGAASSGTACPTATTTAITSPIMDDSLLVEELQGLSVRERERLYEEIHGVAEDFPETPELIETNVRKLKEELKKIPKQERKDYEKAIFLKPSLEDDQAFQLKFLRNVQHDPKEAANHICQFFTHKVQLFGDDKIVKKITMEDLSHQDIQCLKEGSLYVLELPDQSGRKVIVCDGQDQNYSNWLQMIRVKWYITMRLAEDETQQIKGIVNVILANGTKPARRYSQNMTEMFLKGVPLLAAVPLRISAIHYYFDDPIQRPLIYLLQAMIGKRNRLRFRAHFGTSMEARYNLMTFGINMPDKLFSGKGGDNVGNDNAAKLKLIQGYMEQQIMLEATELQEELTLIQKTCLDPNICALYPDVLDVLVGRGGQFYHRFSGNILLGQLVDEYRPSYMQASERFDKTVIAVDILEKVKASGGRFLERTPYGWKQVDDKLGVRKISQAIRKKPKDASSSDIITTTTTTPSGTFGGDGSVGGGGDDSSSSVAVGGPSSCGTTHHHNYHVMENDPKRIRYTLEGEKSQNNF